MTDAALIDLKDVSRIYRRGAEDIHALERINISVTNGEYFSLLGASGSGKTTLLNIMGCIDNPSAGTVRIRNTDVSRMKQGELTKVRRNTIGFVFQQFFLIPTLTASENVQVPGLFAGNSQRKKRAEELLDLVGLSGRINHLPSQMSGGEMQRTAIARALINSPEILLADEPTGNLDSRNAEAVFGIFKQLNKEGLTIMVVTHSRELAATSNRTLEIKDGKIKTA